MQSLISKKKALLFIVLSLGGAGAAQDATAATPADNLFTSYTVYGGNRIDWVTCGSTSNGTNGCFDSGTLAKLKKPCAITEGPRTIVSNMLNKYVVSNPVYVLDAGTEANSQVTLNIYRKIDTITMGSDTTKFELASQTPLPVNGGPNAVCSMAANNAVLAAGTSQDSRAVAVTLRNLSVFTYGAFSPPINVTEITRDAQGFITVQYGSGNDAGFIQIGPDGSTEGDGGGTSFLINPESAVQLTGAAAATANGMNLTHRNYHKAQ